LTTLKYFRAEYEAHIANHRCPARACQKLLTYTITQACVGCELCSKVCPTKAIAGERKALHVIDQNRCIHCGECHRVCRVDAVALA